jgi:diketogulonate reductase-like aldo/keto reductase
MPVLKSGNPAHMRANKDVYDFEIEVADMMLMDSWNEGSDGAIGEDFINLMV